MKQSRSYYIAGITLCLLTLSFGGYYEFVNTIFAGLLIIFFLYETLICKSKIQSITDSFWFGTILLVGYGISIFYAIDSGIAAEGLAKKSLFFVWGCILLLLTQTERKRLLLWIPYIGFAMVILCGIAYFIPVLQEYVFQNNRLGGWFQYANTCGGFLLIGSVILLLKESRSKLDYIMLLVLLGGILLTGSRSTALLLIFCIIYFIFKMPALRKQLLIGSGLLIVGILAILLLTGNTSNIARITTLFTQSSTIYGRALYNYDGISQLTAHPFGLGYLGFYFIQNKIQTGLYSVRYIHNDWLQIGLDIGILPMILILVIIIKNLWQMRKKSNHSIVLLLLFLQSFMEFNLEYSVMGLLLMLFLSEQSLPNVKPQIIQKSSIAICTAALIPLIYISIPLSLAYMDKTELALKLYPYETNEQLKLLSQSTNENEVAKLAEQILKQNKTCSLAYDAKAIVEMNNGLYPEAVTSMKKSIEYNRFEPQGYEQLEWLLTQIVEQEVVPDTSYYMLEYENLQLLKEQNQEAVSYFGKRINDKVKLTK